MSEIRKNESDMSVSFSILSGNKLAVSELSVFPKELAKEFIMDSKMNESQKDYLIDVLNRSEKIYFYSRLKVPQELTGKGLGTKLLNETLRYMDEINGCLINTANAYGEKTQQDLIKFYQKAGMILIIDDGGLIYSPHINLEELNRLNLNEIKKLKP